jgi:hypothetical protein
VSINATPVDVRIPWRGVLRIWEDRDEDTQQLVKIHTHIAWQEQHREICGRPTSPAGVRAAHLSFRRQLTATLAVKTTLEGGLDAPQLAAQRPRDDDGSLSPATPRRT